jgi:hypothetical protein
LLKFANEWTMPKLDLTDDSHLPNCQEHWFFRQKEGYYIILRVCIKCRFYYIYNKHTAFIYERGVVLVRNSGIPNYPEIKKYEEQARYVEKS